MTKHKIEAMAACSGCTEAGEDMRCYPIDMLWMVEGQPMCEDCAMAYTPGSVRETLPQVTLNDLC